MSKGSKPRPMNMDDYRCNFDRIFGGGSTRPKVESLTPEDKRRIKKLKKDLNECNKAIDDLSKHPEQTEELRKFESIKLLIIEEIEKHEGHL